MDLNYLLFITYFICFFLGCIMFVVIFSLFKLNNVLKIRSVRSDCLFYKRTKKVKEKDWYDDISLKKCGKKIDLIIRYTHLQQAIT